MRLSVAPDLSSKRRIVAVAALVAVTEAVVMLARDGAAVARNLGDTDDALRLVLARELLHGRGWYDQLFTRLNPPHGTYMHWSRLLDGALAAAMAAAGRVLPPDPAELAVRLVWPMLWIAPAVAAALVIARNLGGRSAVLIGAVLSAVELQLYRQFRPGRIDHHNIQITCALAGLAVATQRDLRPRHAALAGVAAGLGLAIGLEALWFQAVVGASVALRLAIDRTNAAVARAYGVALALSTAGFYAVQTPPWRWGLPFCDAIGANLVAALVLAGAGLVLVASLAGRIPAWARWGLLALTGAGAGTLFLGLDPACVHGPFGEVTPQARAFWLDHIFELQPWSATFVRDRPVAIHAAATMVMGMAAALFLWWRDRRGVPQITALAALVAACVAALRAERMEDYSFWFGVPILAAGLSYAAKRFLGDRMVPTVAAAAVLTPIFVGGALTLRIDLTPPAATNAPAVYERCSDNAAFARLRTLPAGVVLADIDLGPYVLANTRQSVLIAPYHRITPTIVAAHDAVWAPPARAEAAVRGLGADYVVDCRVTRAPPLMRSLRAPHPPAWVERASPPGDLLQIWRVRPVAAAGGNGR